MSHQPGCWQDNIYSHVICSIFGPWIEEHLIPLEFDCPALEFMLVGFITGPAYRMNSQTSISSVFVNGTTSMSGTMTEVFFSLVAGRLESWESLKYAIQALCQRRFRTGDRPMMFLSLKTRRVGAEVESAIIRYLEDLLADICLPASAVPSRRNTAVRQRRRGKRPKPAQTADSQQRSELYGA